MADQDYFGIDKLKHIIVCFAISILHPYLAIGAAGGKEYGDYKSSGNHFCIWDLVADFIGIILGYGTRLLLLRLIA